MKKVIAILSIVLLTGVFSAFAQTNSRVCPKDCCSTEACKTKCIESKCCEEGKTCDITKHTDCKHKCCDVKSKTCSTQEKKTCCKTK